MTKGLIISLLFLMIGASCGQTSEGLEIEVWHGLHQKTGHLGIAQDDFNVLGKVISAGDSIVSLTCRLNGAPAVPLTVAWREYGFRRLAEKGSFNADIPIAQLKMGENHVELHATDIKNRSAVVAVTIEKKQGNYPLPVSIKWKEVKDPQDAGQYVDGHWALDEKGLRTLQTGYDRIFLIGEKDWQDYEVTIPVTIHKLDSTNQPLSGGNGVGLVMRFTGHVNGGYRNFPEAQPKWGYQPFGAIGWLRWSKDDHKLPPRKQFYAGYTNRIINHGDFPVELGKTYWMKMRCETLAEILPADSVLYEETFDKWENGKRTKGQVSEEELKNANITRYSFKIWPEGETEPDHWDWIQTQVSVHALAKGGVALLAHHVHATFGDVKIEAIDKK